jgi:gamma-glutamylcyclotransferase (GGCT)/AIG2-like uncharacterized protein YtfP
MTNLLFVYGTLRKDVRNSMFHLLAREARFIGRARVQGFLLDLGEYPGFVPSAAPGEWVHGEVYALDFPDQTIARLDEYEGCGPSDPPPHEFERVVTEIVLGAGQAETAWVYVYRGVTGDKRRIPSGDYFGEAR